jgi:transposase
MTLQEIDTIIDENTQLKQQVALLTDELLDVKDQLHWLKRQVFGQKTERFIGTPEEQTSLDLDVTPLPVASAPTQKISFERRTPVVKTPHGRDELPAHLPRKETVLEPTGDFVMKQRIGEKITEQLEYTPPTYYVKRIVRPVYAVEIQGERTLVCAELPSQCNDKGKYGASIIAHATVAKFEDHTPIYRLQKQIKRDSGMDIPESSLDKLPQITAFWLEPIYNRLDELVGNSVYRQIDESTVKVMINPTNGKSSTGYFWLRHTPIEQITLLDYQRHRSAAAAKEVLGDFKGILQTDGYVVYDAYSKMVDIVHAGCHAHARRGFQKSLDNDRDRSEIALKIYKEMFVIEEQAREENLTAEQRLELRIRQTRPLIDKFKNWLDEQSLLVRPKSRIGKAIAYCLNRWTELTAFMKDGRIELSNNFVENAVRILALGRKNWLFAGSEEAAKNMGIIYSIAATCKLHGLNFFDYLVDVLDQLPNRTANMIDDLLPMNWKPPVAKI